MTRHRWLLPYLLMAPGLLWLAALLRPAQHPDGPDVPVDGDASAGLEFAWAFDNYIEAFGRFPDNFLNSLVFGGLATLLCFLIGYPMAYGIAFRGGRYKTLLLFLVIAPFFTSFLIRTISWRIILGDQGAFLSVVRDTLGVVPANFSIIGTPLAVVVRTDLPVPAVHGAPALRRAREDRLTPHRGRARPVRRAVAARRGDRRVDRRSGHDRLRPDGSRLCLARRGWIRRIRCGGRRRGRGRWRSSARSSSPNRSCG